MKIFAAILFIALNLSAQTNPPAASPATVTTPATNPPPSAVQRAEQIRAECVAGRRVICGKILKVLPGGLVVDSGYADLLRAPLNKSWLVPGSVSASRDANQIETREPGAVCIGVVYLTNLPKSRGVKPKQYDYVTLLGYPTGQYTYASVGEIKKTVRAFSANILSAVNQNLAAEGNKAAVEPSK